jgi:hypothetical protein
LGETIKHAWLETDLHDRLKKFLLKGQPHKIERITNSIKRRISMSTRYKMDLAEIDIHIEESLNEPTKIIINIVLPEDGRVPSTRSEVLKILL